jgi:hypothetical protein
VQASPTINPSREISGVILMQVLPFADNKCPQTFAAVESGVCALLDAAQRPAWLRSFSHSRRIEFLSRRFKQQNWRDKWLAQLKTLTLS